MFDLTQLSKREKQILDLLAQGYGPSEVGKRLFLSVKTVSTYRFRIRDKFGITHGTQWMALLRQIPLRDDLAASVTFGSFAKECST